ncbi:hypothetical protein [Halobacterium sp. CBA1126]|nr:hypothetical protein [Halobacterium sp. CBA1126]MUV60086.1 hypothetical protein [Halobacterium sp. CBA1126]
MPDAVVCWGGPAPAGERAAGAREDCDAGNRDPRRPAAANADGEVSE